MSINHTIKRLASVMVVLAAGPACAFEDMDTDPMRQAWTWDTPAPPTIKRRTPQVKAWERREPQPKRLIGEINEPRSEKNACSASVTVVGDEARTKETAELQARQHWMKSVRFDLGEKYLELGNARDVFFQCSRSDFPITGGKLGAAADAVTHSWRCKIKATPCVAPMAREDK